MPVPPVGLLTLTLWVTGDTTAEIGCEVIEMKPVIIDVEASGFGRGSYPIEIGFVLGNGQSHCALIRRQPEWQHWDARAEKLHGISRQTLEKYGKDVVEVATMLNQQLAGEVVYSDAWGHDSSWLALLFDAAELSQHFCLEPLRSLLKEKQLKAWHETKEQVAEDYGFPRHRASNDALILQTTYSQTLQLAGCKRAV